jgi:hypothetical protein
MSSLSARAPVAQLAEAVGSKPMCCGFESRPGYPCQAANGRHRFSPPRCCRCEPRGSSLHRATFGRVRAARLPFVAPAAGRGVPRGARRSSRVTRDGSRTCPTADLPHDGRIGTDTGTTRQTTKVRERLARIQEELRRVRATERVLVEQVAHLDEVAADAETRKLVAQTPLADREWREARTDLDRHRVLLEEAREEAQDLLHERDRLLDRLFELETTARRRDDE